MVLMLNRKEIPSRWWFTSYPGNSISLSSSYNWLSTQQRTTIDCRLQLKLDDRPILTETHIHYFNTLTPLLHQTYFLLTSYVNPIYTRIMHQLPYFHSLLTSANTTVKHVIRPFSSRLTFQYSIDFISYYKHFF